MKYCIECLQPDTRPNSKFIKKICPVCNYKKTILISHHGTAILEALFLNFKCISSKAIFWSSKFKATNNWNNKINYKKLLIKDWKQLQSCKKDDFYSICHQIFCNPLAHYGKYYWHQFQ